MLTFKIRFEYKLLLVNFIFLLISLNSFSQEIEIGAEQTHKYLKMLKGKKVGLVVNQTSVVGNTHLVDTLRKLKVKITGIFAPEHGFRGNYEAGAVVSNETDKKTGIPLISLYGKNKKPQPSQLKNIDVIVFDIQDVGARFYTYISTLHFVMEACAEQNKTLIVLDRPNPNGFYVDGPVLDTAFKSFVGMHPVPIVHGMTIGEYALMINGEGWLNKRVKCKLTVIKMHNYNHSIKYTLPIRPSPNLPRMEAIYLYPSLCLFEGTSYSVGRGTTIPFECVGKPGLTNGTFSFTPVVIKGVADNPPHVNVLCHGFQFTNRINEAFFKQPQLMIDIILATYKNDPDTATFFNSFFDKLAGSDKLRKQIIAGLSADEIKRTWQSDLNRFMVIRSKYLLYEE